jgi:hypothetical protein
LFSRRRLPGSDAFARRVELGSVATDAHAS